MSELNKNHKHIQKIVVIFANLMKNPSGGYLLVNLSISHLISELQRQMSEPVRNSTRPKKPPRYLNPDESQYDFQNQTQYLENIEAKKITQELNQIAKLFTKFIQIANQKAETFYSYKQPLRPTPVQPINENTSNLIAKQITISQNQKPLQNSQPTSKPSKSNKRNGGHEMNEKNKTEAKNNNKKVEPPKRAALGLPSSNQSGLKSHNMLLKQIQTLILASKSLSTEVLIKLGFPAKETLQQKKAKENEKKKTGSGVHPLVPQIKEQEKLYKRQSYHVGSAFYIFCKKNILCEKVTRSKLDPIFDSRELKRKLQKS